ncbi:substrate-binding family protein [Sinorhizobium medicae]|uniref:branched-chain amino acid ABC transporter substrate-binding protein n=1 Tax=Sinorhizobium medicae TaxID=110321 RepID=UPI0011A3E5D2|nr:branched-chain amino acid ABC transporter substrate-binding protein [Sinorhizobium medicae]TWA26354.1 substrate-binding family protein [Sinorhizobium medicae]
MAKDLVKRTQASWFIVALFGFSIEQASAEILIGVAGPLTGPNAAFGAQLQKGAEQAASDINAAGGISGEQITIILGDDVSDPKQGISIANKFVADGVKFVVGHFNPSVSIPASEVYAENGVLQLSPASGNPEFTERGLWNTIRVTRRDDAVDALLTDLRDPREFSSATEAVSSVRASGFEPEGYTLYSYAAVELIAAGMRKIGTDADPTDVARALKDGSEYQTILGPLRFAENGDLLDSTVFNGEESKDCPACPKSGNCPQYVISAVAQCCKKSGACPQ